MNQRPKTPMLNRITNTRNDRILLQNFIEWLGENDLHICTWYEYDGSNPSGYDLTHVKSDDMIDGMLEIDRVQAEEERLELLKWSEETCQQNFQDI